MIRNVCFINNYNNELYIRECLDSVYSQSHPFDEVLVVDDGSTDYSLKIIEEFSSRRPNLKLVQKENEGQFSTFNAVLPLLADNSQIFLLDGDDVYPFDYLEKTISLIGSSSWDFAFCEQQKFNSKVSTLLSSVRSNESAGFLSSTSALVRSRGCWIGNPTSCISLSSDLYKKIFPYPYFQDKSFWADNLIIYTSSILGAKKIHLPSLGIGYRIHALNDSKKKYSSADIATREFAIERAFSWYCQKYSMPRYPGIFEFFKEYARLDAHWKKRLDLPSMYRILNRLIRNSITQFFANKSIRN